MDRHDGGDSPISNAPATGTYLALLAAILGPLLSYVVAARKLSGQIKDSEATELWAESRAIREWSSKEISDLRAYVTKLETRVGELETENKKIKLENKYLNAVVERLQGGKP